VSTLYRAHAESMTENGHVIECERLRVNEKHHGLAVGSPVQWPEERRRAVGHTLFASALAELRRRDTAAGLNKLRQALEVWPGVANQDEFYFELACAYQARGVRGTSRDLDLEKGAQLMRLLPLPDGSWGRAYFALARVALVAGDRRAGRRYSRKALRSSSLRWKGRALAMVATSTLPLELSRSLSRWRQAWRANVFQGAGFPGK